MRKKKRHDNLPILIILLIALFILWAQCEELPELRDLGFISGGLYLAWLYWKKTLERNKVRKSFRILEDILKRDSEQTFKEEEPKDSKLYIHTEYQGKDVAFTLALMYIEDEPLTVFSMSFILPSENYEEDWKKITTTAKSVAKQYLKEQECVFFINEETFHSCQISFEAKIFISQDIFDKLYHFFQQTIKTYHLQSIEHYIHFYDRSAEYHHYMHYRNGEVIKGIIVTKDHEYISMEPNQSDSYSLYELQDDSELIDITEISKQEFEEIQTKVG